MTRESPELVSVNVESRTILSLGKKGGLSREQQIEVMRLVESQGGWLFRTEIEGVWVSFPDTFGALCSTAQILHLHNSLKAGLHRGEITLTEDGDLLGNTLSVAKRLESTVEPGAVHLLPEVLGEVKEPLFFVAVSEPRTVVLKNLGPSEALTLTPIIQERKRAFKFLDSFSIEDREFFFGREAEVRELFEQLEQNRCLTLFGPSGVGKSSLLGAGLYPLYQDLGVEVLTLRCLTNPLTLLGNLLECPIRELPSKLKGKEPGLLLCLDQFEEFFLRVPREQRMEFWNFLKQCLEDPELGSVRWLFSLRQDFLAEMGEAEEVLEGFLDSRLSLSPLSKEQAALSIVGPAQRCGRWVEPELVERLLHDLYRDGINPPELQIVLDRLDTTREPNNHWLTEEAYQRLGGFREILVDYLYEVLERAEESTFTRRVLLALVTEEETKKACRPDEISAELETDLPSVETALKPLLEARLVRRIADSGVVELSHEYLITEIQGWANEAELAARYAKATLDDEIDSWKRLGSLLERSKLHFLNQQQSVLKPSEEKRRLLLRANIVYGEEPRLWLRGEDDVEFLLTLLDHYGEGEVQRRVIAELYHLTLSERALIRVLQATRRYGNPNLLRALKERPDRRKEALKRSVSQRFLGPEKMVKIPAGPFLFGSTAENKKERKENLHRYIHPKIDSEADLREEHLEDFWMDICPVTNAEFAEFSPSHRDRYPDHEGEHPVVSVTLFEAESYAHWLGKELPTELEWEKAARGTGGRLYPWGDRYCSDHLNSGDDNFKQTTPVNRYGKGKSPYGCFDMAGNVWEWTCSKWAEPGPFIVQKGGSTLCRSPQLQCSSRMDAFPDFVLRWTGFRLKSDSPALEDL